MRLLVLGQLKAVFLESNSFLKLFRIVLYTRGGNNYGRDFQA